MNLKICLLPEFISVFFQLLYIRILVVVPFLVCFPQCFIINTNGIQMEKVTFPASLWIRINIHKLYSFVDQVFELQNLDSGCLLCGCAFKMIFGLIMIIKLLQIVSIDLDLDISLKSFYIHTAACQPVVAVLFAFCFMGMQTIFQTRICCVNMFFFLSW